MHGMSTPDDNSCDATTAGGNVLITLDFQVLIRATTRIDFDDSPFGEKPVLREFDLLAPPLVEGVGNFRGGELEGD